MKKTQDKKNEKLNEKIIALFEIALAISLTITTAYFIHESSSLANPGYGLSDDSEIKLSKVAIILSLIGKIIFGERGIVSAQEIYTCLKNKNGSICQEYISDECDSQCSSECIPSSRDSVSECKLGTCFDKTEGTCTTQSPKGACENNRGIWFSDPNANVKECQRRCCILGDNAIFVTQQTCNRQSLLIGINGTFNTAVKDEFSCLILSKVQEEGACTFVSEYETTCKYTTKADCLKLKGDFHSGYLCSAKELNTDCKPQATVGCVSGKDEIYWFDSCGNRENIYDINKDKSWNSGKVLAKDESCSLGSLNNPFANRGTCGNCFYLTGSRCGLKTETQKLDDSGKNVVCRDLTCTDESGKLRQNGESWCDYDSSIGIEQGSGLGVDGTPLTRATDTPGSEHFRKVCKDGEIIIEPCGGYRNQICVESKTTLDNGKSYSSAACKFNTWQNCLEYNYDLEDEEDKEIVAEECNSNPDCFMKEVNIASHFKYSLCVPKYPPGFSFSEGRNSMASKLCGYATQTCTAIYVKQIDRWECKANCDCESSKFTEQMNDLCISLGDCGAEVNYNGDLTENYKVTGAPKLSQSYLDGIKKYSNPIPGKVAEPGDFTGSIPGFLDSTTPDGGGEKGMDFVQMGFGAAGMLLPMLAEKVGVAGWTVVEGLGQGGSHAIAEFSGKGAQTAAQSFAKSAGLGTEAVKPVMSTLGNALKAAGAVVAVAAILYQIYSFAASGDYMMAGIVAATAIAATAVTMAAIGTGFTTAAGGLFTIAGASAVFPIVGIVVVAVIAILKFLLGLGKTREVKVEFKCKPWQPPVGGVSCDECGGNGLPCTKYSCSALGQGCELINEGTSKESCTWINPNDVSAPTITPLLGVITENYSYNDVLDNGFKIKNNDNNGCIESYTKVMFGINVSEYAYCKVDSKHTNSFNEMSEDFGDNYYMKSHEIGIFMPSLESLGIPGYDPTRKTDYNLFVRCQDKNGNSNIKEYNINFCVKPGIDITPPVVASRLPKYEYIKYGIEKFNASVYTNEPSECRYDISDIPYDLMTNEMQCNNNLLQQEPNGWRCNAEFNAPENDSSVYYINCKDQPWLVESPDGISPAKIIVSDGENETKEIEVSSDRKRNSMANGYKYVARKSKTELNIDYAKPDGETIESSVEPVSVYVEVKTSGGADGIAECMYKSGEKYIDFRDTFSTIHKQTFNQMKSGDASLDIKCIDMAENSAEKTIGFSVAIDTDAPIVTRAYKNGGNMVIVTDEDAKCSYQKSVAMKTNYCDFAYAGGEMMQDSGEIHSTPFDSNFIYYIKCKDNYGNENGVCATIVKGVELTAGGGTGLI